jgi:signal peptidase I
VLDVRFVADPIIVTASGDPALGLASPDPADPISTADNAAIGAAAGDQAMGETIGAPAPVAEPGDPSLASAPGDPPLEAAPGDPPLVAAPGDPSLVAPSRDPVLGLTPVDSTLAAAAAAPASDLRLTSPGIRLAQVQEELVAWVKTLLSAAVYAILIVTFGFQVARVEGQSMAPTLEDQDRLIVNKLVYRIGEPRRGDIVMLYYPLDPDKSFVKRVIAEETDSVRIVDGRVYVNDVPLHDEYVPNEYRSHDDWGPQVIPEGYYFVMGDHRNNSSDSRHWGMVPKRYIIGKVQVRWWPVPSARVF